MDMFHFNYQKLLMSQISLLMDPYIYNIPAALVDAYRGGALSFVPMILRNLLPYWPKKTRKTSVACSFSH